MGVNRAGFGIVDDAAVRHAATQEVIRRNFRYSCEYAMGLCEKETVERSCLIMEELGTGPEDRSVVVPARRASEAARDKGKGNEGIYCGAAIQLSDGHIVTGQNSPLMHAASALVLNAAKQLAGIPDSLFLLPATITQTLTHFKKDVLQGRMMSLDLEETLIALCISALSNPAAQAAVEQLPKLRGCEVHMTHIPTPGDEAGLRKLGVNLTTDTDFATRSLFVK